jgi:hypothetical protein
VDVVALVLTSVLFALAALLFVVPNDRNGQRAKRPTWCQGCDELSPASSFGWTELGLYRCRGCRGSKSVESQDVPFVGFFFDGFFDAFMSILNPTSRKIAKLEAEVQAIFKEWSD